MGYDLYAFIAKRGTFDEFKPLSTKVVVVELEQGFDMMLKDWHLEEALQLPYETPSEGFEKEMGLSSSMIQLIEKRSFITSIAYVSIDFFGGSGWQHAVVWKDRKIILLPENNGYFPYVPENIGPVNIALRSIGVQAGQWDEFLTIGFTRHRHMEDWFAASTGLSISDYVPDEG